LNPGFRITHRAEEDLGAGQNAKQDEWLGVGTRICARKDADYQGRGGFIHSMYWRQNTTGWQLGEGRWSVVCHERNYAKTLLPDAKQFVLLLQLDPAGSWALRIRHYEG